MDFPERFAETCGWCEDTRRSRALAISLIEAAYRASEVILGALTGGTFHSDVLIVCDLHKLDGRGMRGAPHWIAEVLSPTTASYDQITKLPAYERAGVPELWLIHPTDRTLVIYRLTAGHYTRPIILELKGRTAITAVPGVSIDWDRLLANVT